MEILSGLDISIDSDTLKVNKISRGKIFNKGFCNA